MGEISGVPSPYSNSRSARRGPFFAAMARLKGKYPEAFTPPMVAALAARLRERRWRELAQTAARLREGGDSFGYWLFILTRPGLVWILAQGRLGPRIRARAAPWLKVRDRPAPSPG